jgi:hypothetical protein
MDWLIRAFCFTAAENPQVPQVFCTTQSSRDRCMWPENLAAACIAVFGEALV